MTAREQKHAPHRRWNPLLREWVLVSPHRTQRPWLGQVAAAAAPPQVEYDPDCYLCPGNSRAGGARNPAYTATFVFDNDYPALLPDAPASQIDQEAQGNQEGLLVARAERGICRVVCFSPRHDLTIPRMQPEEVRAVVDVWTDQYREMGAIPWVQHVQIFENRGALMGASNPHPHCQIWTNETLPNQPARELAAQTEYFEGQGKCLLCSYLRIEQNDRVRMVAENESFVALVPYWAVWPFETMLLSRRHVGSLIDLNEIERNDLAAILRSLTIRYDNLFTTAFPYTMGFHQQPTDDKPHPEWHFHAHYFPPLLRSATVQKFMVGYEMLGSPQRDITAENAAAHLRGLGEVHFLDRG
jgi:UDPglucose--hexose-1-phosphate uridylyltransferase